MGPMQQVEYFFKNIAKPLIWFANQLILILFKLDKWYKDKKPETKKDLRWIVAFVTLLFLYAYEKYQSDARADSDNIRNTIHLNHEKRAREECEKERLKYLQMHIEKLEKYKERIEENTKKLEEAKDSKQ